MLSQSLVEIADRKSRLRAVLFAAATLVFLLVQAITHPVFDGGAYARGWRLYAWLFNAALLLACLGAGGGFANRRPLRVLIHDEVAQSHNRTACKAAFWVVMIASLALYVLPVFRSFTGLQVSYVIVTLGTATALLTFSWLEFQSHADA
jgi:ABC-type microcin C transport system permease subunit YejB